MFKYSTINKLAPDLARLKTVAVSITISKRVYAKALENIRKRGLSRRRGFSHYVAVVIQRDRERLQQMQFINSKRATTSINSKPKVTTCKDRKQRKH